MTQEALAENSGETVAGDTRVEFSDNILLVDLCGPHDRNLAALEAALGVSIIRRGNELLLQGDAEARTQVEQALAGLYERLEEGKGLDVADVDAAIRFAQTGTQPTRPDPGQLELFEGGRLEIRTKKRVIEPRSNAQRHYVSELFRKQMVFGVGPAGTGKTYLAVAAAVSLFLEGQVDRIILSRPAVEAGERLGFLPGDMKEKIDPYLQPLYDAMNDMMPGRQIAKHMEEGRIEVAPLAFMRGRTLANAYVVLDEAQNTTTMQMKMFLTRLGENSHMAITGDPSQTDLPRGVPSGLSDALRILSGVKDIGIVRFAAQDVVRHPLVAAIVEAYDADSPDENGGPRR